MVAIGMGLFWTGYGVGFWGWCLIRGYDITVAQIFSPVNFYDASKWPPPPIPDGQFFPGGSGPSSSGTPPPAGPGNPYKPVVPGVCKKGYTYDKKLKVCLPAAGPPVAAV